MAQLSSSFAPLLDAFASCFRVEVYHTFRAVVAAWILCPGVRTLSEVWQAIDPTRRGPHDRVYALFACARWHWDDLGTILLRLVVARLVPDGPVWFAVDDTLCHKRGAKVAGGGIFLDPVASSKRHKVFRFGLNWVVLGVVVAVPLRPGRFVCLPILWRLFRKAGTPGHRPRTELAAEMIRRVGTELADRECWVAGDMAYLNRATLRDRPANVRLVGPLRLDAALYAPPPPRRPGQRGAPRKRGARLATPRAAFADLASYPALEHDVGRPDRPKRVRTQVMAGVLWYTGANTERLSVVLVRDLAGTWPDTALLVTDAAASAAFAVAGYGRRWSIEVAFRDSKQYLGLHDPHVRAEASVERAHPLAWFARSLTVLWSATAGAEAPAVRRDRPWYARKPAHTFTDMLGALRLELWRTRIPNGSGEHGGDPELLETLLHWVAAVR